MITSKLSGAYNSACMARDIVKKESPDKQMFDNMEAPGKNSSGSFQACGGSASEGCI